MGLCLFSFIALDMVLFRTIQSRMVLQNQVFWTTLGNPTLFLGDPKFWILYVGFAYVLN